MNKYKKRWVLQEKKHFGQKTQGRKRLRRTPYFSYEPFGKTWF